VTDKIVKFPALVTWNALKITAVVLAKVPVVLVIEVAHAVKHLGEAVINDIAVGLSAIYYVPVDTKEDYEFNGFNLGFRWTVFGETKRTHSRDDSFRRFMHYVTNNPIDTRKEILNLDNITLVDTEGANEFDLLDDKDVDYLQN